MGAIEALYIFDEHNNTLLSHIFNGRPPPAPTILPLYLAHPTPRPSLIYLSNTSPPTLVYSIIQDRLLFLSPSSVDTEPLLVLEFLHRVVDAFEDFLGSPLLASKIESSYDIVAQLLGEMCDAGLIKDTEPNALRDVVEAPSWLKNLLSGVGLPSASTTPTSSSPFSLSGPRSSISRPLSSNQTSPVPWRRANVRHTSNEMYVDIVETLSVLIAPSGRLLSALANGTIVFTAKVSGVPDLLLTLSAPGSAANTLSLPVFHPCVRLKNWRDKPGELSFVPPDGRFVLAGYEVDLLGDDYLELASKALKEGRKVNAPALNLPAMVSLRTSLGPTGSEFETRLSLSTRFRSSGRYYSSSGFSSGGRPTAGLRGLSAGGLGGGGTSSAPVLDDLLVTIPMPLGVRNILDIRPSRGEAVWQPTERRVEWRIPSKEVTSVAGQGREGGEAVLHCSVAGADADSDSELDFGGIDEGLGEYQEDTDGYQSAALGTGTKDEKEPDKKESKRDMRKVRKSEALMPTSAAVSFQVRGWLASGVRVESLVIDPKRSRGLGAGVQPYKGVKYLTCSEKGIECRA